MLIAWRARELVTGQVALYFGISTGWQTPENHKSICSFENSYEDFVSHTRIELTCRIEVTASGRPRREFRRETLQWLHPSWLVQCFGFDAMLAACQAAGWGGLNLSPSIIYDTAAICTRENCANWCFKCARGSRNPRTHKKCHKMMHDYEDLWVNSLKLMCLQPMGWLSTDSCRSLRLTSFRDSSLRLSAASILEKASRQFCPQAGLETETYMVIICHYGQTFEYSRLRVLSKCSTHAKSPFKIDQSNSLSGLMAPK